jgi:LemA protein
VTGAIIGGVAFVVIIILWFILTYNGLVGSRNRVDQSWANIDVQMQKRFELIPNLVATVKGYAKHESETLEAVVQARSQGMGAQTPGALGAAEGMLMGALGKLMVVVENYPELKADKNFLDLQEQLQATESAIAIHRQDYNQTATNHNVKVQSLPTNIIAGMFGFKTRELFEVSTPEARTAPKVEF